jgi:GNAT superfamily N-acetyltransferase
MSYGEMREAYDWEVHTRQTLVDPMDRGFMTFELAPDGGLYIVEVYVRPSYRRDGVARAMLERIKRIAVQEDRSHIYGTVSTRNPAWRASVAAQEACGFELVNVSEQGEALLRLTLAPEE